MHQSQQISGFAELDLSPEMLQTLERAKYLHPSPVQAGVIPVALEGKDVVGQAQTGTGKTAAFVIPIVEMLDIETKCPDPQSIILVPTRELAVQVHDEFVKLAEGLPIHCTAVYGGAPIRRRTDDCVRTFAKSFDLPPYRCASINCGAVNWQTLRQLYKLVVNLHG